MNFTLQQIQNFLKIVQNNNIDKINIKNSSFNMIINKTASTRSLPNSSLSTLTKISKEIILEPQQKIEATDINNNTAHNTHQQHDAEIYSTIVSPMVGTFYRSPAPNEPPFIEKNDIVDKKQTVCIIEAMKLMNEIEAEVNGEIVQILVQDGDIVDCGQALMKVKKI